MSSGKWRPFCLGLNVLTYSSWLSPGNYPEIKTWFNYQLNTLRPRQNGSHFPDDIFKCIFLNENLWIFIEISLIFVPKGLINNITALVQIMAWRQPGDKPLSEPMMVRLPTHICVTRPQWVNAAEWCIYLSTSKAIIGIGNGLSPVWQHHLNQCWHIKWTHGNKFQWILNQTFWWFRMLTSWCQIKWPTISHEISQHFKC